MTRQYATRIRFLWLGLICFLALVTGCQRRPAGRDVRYDLVLQNGRIMDPETELDSVGSIGITDGVIRVFSTGPLKGKTMIDAAGLVVCPGFIDLHLSGSDCTVRGNPLRAGEWDPGGQRRTAGGRGCPGIGDSCIARLARMIHKSSSPPSGPSHLALQQDQTHHVGKHHQAQQKVGEIPDRLHFVAGSENGESAPQQPVTKSKMPY